MADGTFIDYRYRMYEWVRVDADAEAGVVVARSECAPDLRTYCVRFPTGDLRVFAECDLSRVRSAPAEQAGELNATAAWGEAGEVPETPMEAMRWATRSLELDKLNKGAVIGLYRELGGLSPAESWRKDEVINAVIDMEKRTRRLAWAQSARERERAARRGTAR
jgi:hypothetical protein